VCTATVYSGPITCQVVHVGSLRRVAVAAPRPPNISSQPARRAVRESLVTNRGPSLTLVTIPSRNSHRRVVTSRTLNPATHNLPTASSACRWRVPPLGTAVWRRPTRSGRQAAGGRRWEYGGRRPTGGCVNGRRGAGWRRHQVARLAHEAEAKGVLRVIGHRVGVGSRRSGGGGGRARHGPPPTRPGRNIASDPNDEMSHAIEEDGVPTGWSSMRGGGLVPGHWPHELYPWRARGKGGAHGASQGFSAPHVRTVSGFSEMSVTDPSRSEKNYYARRSSHLMLEA